jgi:antitoxin Phd
MHEVQLREAKATLSAVVDDAKQGRPSVITRHGRREAVIVSFEEWERLSNVPSLGWLLAQAPLDAADMPDRVAGDWREVEL